MKLSNLVRTLFIVLLIYSKLEAQITIINISVQPFNLTPEALLNVNVMNNGEEKTTRVLTQLFSADNTVLLTVKSSPFKLSKGLNSVGASVRKVESAEFSGSTQGNYLKTTHNLPSGRYKVCSVISAENDPETSDNFCDELEADFNQYLYLVNPFDKDTVDSKNPILSWIHNEPFSILRQGEYYRMIVSEIKTGQSAEEAITINATAMVKSYLKEHQLVYPYDAKELKPGSMYAWQVQKVSDGVVINKTEAWTFFTRRINNPKSSKYVNLKPELDGSFYEAVDGFVYFKFSEEYATSGQLKFTLTNDKSQIVEADIKKDDCSAEGVTLKSTGTNLFELNLNTKKNKSGFYKLEVKNEKNESFYLKLFLP